jgi:hypothetical protein
MENNEMYIPNDIIKNLQTDVTDTRKDVSEIKSALLGNEYNPDGLIKRQCNTEERLTKAEGKIDKIFWTAAGISGGVSGLIGIVALILKFVIK